MPPKAKTTDAPALPLDAAAELQRLKSEAAALRAEADAAKAEAAAAKAEAEKARADAAAANTTGKAPGFHAIPQLSEGDRKAGIVAKACAILPNGRRFDYVVKTGSDGRRYVREDYERRFVNDGKGGKRPTSGLDATIGDFAYVMQWRIENPTVMAAVATWAAEHLPAAAEPTTAG